MFGKCFGGPREFDCDVFLFMPDAKCRCLTRSLRSFYVERFVYLEVRRDKSFRSVLRFNVTTRLLRFVYVEDTLIDVWVFISGERLSNWE